MNVCIDCGTNTREHGPLLGKYRSVWHDDALNKQLVIKSRFCVYGFVMIVTIAKTMDPTLNVKLKITFIIKEAKF